MKKRVYPEQPLVGVGALVLKQDSVLLVRRGNPPLEGTWSLPGGRCREDERLRDALIREVHEECRIDIEVVDFLKLFEYIERDDRKRVKYHYIVFDFKALYKSGTLQHSSDASDARWVRIDELDKYELTDAVRGLVKEAMNPGKKDNCNP
jgi:8-oxo-dGTP diphosphatase